MYVNGANIHYNVSSVNIALGYRAKLIWDVKLKYGGKRITG